MFAKWSEGIDGLNSWRIGFGLMKGLVFACILLGGAFVFLSNPLFGIPGTDSSIFYYVAKGVRDGLMPYRDVFDQKGPLLYLFDFCAVWGVERCALIGSWSAGMWLLDLVAFIGGFAAVAFVLIKSEWSGSRLGVAISMAIISVYYHLVACGGNMPEMWIIVFSGLAYGLILKGLREEFLGCLNLIIIGFCIALVMMLKLNMIAVVVPLLVTLYWIGRWKCGWVFAGWLIGLTPFLLWFAFRGALSDFWNVYVCYNLEYAMRMGHEMPVNRAFVPVALLAGINCVAWQIERLRLNRRVLLVNFAYLVTAILMCVCFGGSIRYYGPVIPAMIIPLVWFCEKMKRRFLIALFFGSVVLVGMFAFLRNRHGAEVRAAYAELRELGKTISDKKSVMAVGCDCYAYFALGATCPIKYPFQGTVAYCSESRKEEILSALRTGRVRYLVIPADVLNRGGWLGVSWARETIENRYRVVASGRSYDIREFAGIGIRE